MRVTISERAEADIWATYQWWAKNRSSDQAGRWYVGIGRTINSLSLDAERHPLASENDRLPFKARQLLFGLGRRPSHRVLFTIRPDGVYVLRVRHVAQDALGLDDL